MRAGETSADAEFGPLRIDDHPRARLLQHCDAVLRLPGESAGADNDVAIALERGLPVYHRIEEIPAA